MRRMLWRVLWTARTAKNGTAALMDTFYCAIGLLSQFHSRPTWLVLRPLAAARLHVATMSDGLQHLLLPKNGVGRSRAGDALAVSIILIISWSRPRRIIEPHQPESELQCTPPPPGGGVSFDNNLRPKNGNIRHLPYRRSRGAGAGLGADAGAEENLA